MSYTMFTSWRFLAWLGGCIREFLLGKVAFQFCVFVLLNSFKAVS